MKIEKINNPHYNHSNELIYFDGMKMIDCGTDKNGNKILKADKNDPDTKEIINFIKELPRTNGEYTGSAAPKVSIGGESFSLSYKFFTDKEVETYKSYTGKHSGTKTPTSKIPEAFIDEILAKTDLSEECLKFFKEEKEKLNKAKAAGTDKAVAALKALGYSDEVIKSTLAIQGIEWNPDAE